MVNNFKKKRKKKGGAIRWIKVLKSISNGELNMGSLNGVHHATSS